MKKYVIPNMKIVKFTGSVQTAAEASAPVQQEYVTGLKDVENKRQVTLSEMAKIATFVY